MACGATLSLKRSLELDPVHEVGLERSGKRRRCLPSTMSGAVPPTKQHQMNRSLFTPAAARITSEQIAAQINAEIKRMQRRRQLNVVSLSDDESHGSTSTACTEMSSPSSSASSSSIWRESSLHNDKALFTQKQIGWVCERMVREKEGALKEEYEKVLSSKLAEQYDAFLMFNKDELHRQYKETAASYVS